MTEIVFWSFWKMCCPDMSKMVVHTQSKTNFGGIRKMHNLHHHFHTKAEFNTFCPTRKRGMSSFFESPANVGVKTVVGQHATPWCEKASSPARAVVGIGVFSCAFCDAGLGPISSNFANRFGNACNLAKAFSSPFTQDV